MTERQKPLSIAEIKRQQRLKNAARASRSQENIPQPIVAEVVKEPVKLVEGTVAHSLPEPIIPEVQSEQIVEEHYIPVTQSEVKQETNEMKPAVEEEIIFRASPVVESEKTYPTHVTESEITITHPSFGGPEPLQDVVTVLPEETVTKQVNPSQDVSAEGVPAAIQAKQTPVEEFADLFNQKKTWQAIMGYGAAVAIAGMFATGFGQALDSTRTDTGEITAPTQPAITQTIDYPLEIVPPTQAVRTPVAQDGTVREIPALQTVVATEAGTVDNPVQYLTYPTFLTAVAGFTAGVMRLRSRSNK